MKLRFRDPASAELESFVDRYKEAFRTLYSDTGLWNEHLIIEGYEHNAMRLYHAMKDAITSRLTQRLVAGRKEMADDWFEIYIPVQNRRVFVLYSEDKKVNTRWVESISIDRKPIIF